MTQCKKFRDRIWTLLYCKIKQRIHGDDKSHKLIMIVHVCGRWMMEWNTPFMNLSLSLSLLYLDIMRTWLYRYLFLLFLFFFSWTLMCPFFLGHASWACHLFFSPCLIWRILEREIIKHGVYFVDGWNGIADFQCRSSAGGVHMSLIKQVWKDISLGSQSLKKLNATTRHICVRFVSWRSTYGFGRTNT